jgi:hypothetical protein
MEKDELKQMPTSGGSPLNDGLGFELNISNYCWVQLTEAGKNELKKQHDELNFKYKGLLGQYEQKKEDLDGWSKWQIHEVMSNLGHMVISGGVLPFKPIIMIEPNAKLICAGSAQNETAEGKASA